MAMAITVSVTPEPFDFEPIGQRRRAALLRLSASSRASAQLSAADWVCLLRVTNRAVSHCTVFVCRAGVRTNERSICWAAARLGSARGAERRGGVEGAAVVAGPRAERVSSRMTRKWSGVQCYAMPSSRLAASQSTCS